MNLGSKSLKRESVMPTLNLTEEIISAAIEGLEARKVSIDSKIAELRALLSGGSVETAATPNAPKAKRHKMSAAARKRIGDAQRKRWAASKIAPEPAAPEAPKKKRKLSKAGRAAIVAATKKRWAAVKAAKEK